MIGEKNPVKAGSNVPVVVWLVTSMVTRYKI